MNADPSPGRSPSRLTRVVVAVAIIAGGLIARYLLIKAVASLHPPNWYIYGPDIFYVLSGKYEPVGLAFVATAALLFVVLQLVFRRGAVFAPDLSWRQVLVISLAVFLFCWWGTGAFYRRFPMSLDESAAFFQAHAFLEGHITSKIPPDLVPFRHAITPEFIELLPGNSVVSSYFPIYASLLALGTLVFGSPWVVNPLLSAGSIFLLYGIGRNLAISRAFTGWAVILLATSSQFLVTGMSAYAMTSHLFFNLGWLYFYTHPNRRLYYLCPPIGVLALGLHNPFCHTFFVLPFLLRLLLDRRWPEAAYSVVVYLAGCLFWFGWMRAMRPEDVAMAGKVFVLPGLQAGFIFFLSMLLLISWQNFLAVLFFVASLFRARAMPPFFRDLLLGLALTMAFYLFYVRSQGAGWGYRYMHQVLGNLVLIAAWGAAQSSLSRINFVAITLLALGLQLPFRCLEAREVVGRQAAAYNYISHLDADFVIIDRGAGYSSVELMRNDPDFKNRPIMLFRSLLTDAQFRDLMDHHKTVLISSDEFRKLNIPVLR